MGLSWFSCFSSSRSLRTPPLLVHLVLCRRFCSKAWTVLWYYPNLQLYGVIKGVESSVNSVYCYVKHGCFGSRDVSINWELQCGRNWDLQNGMGHLWSVIRGAQGGARLDKGHLFVFIPCKMSLKHCKQSPYSNVHLCGHRIRFISL